MTLPPLITWVPVSEELPDDDTSVLLATSDGEVCAGFHESGNWHHLNADPVAEPVTHWTHYPAHPTL